MYAIPCFENLYSPYGGCTNKEKKV